MFEFPYTYRYSPLPLQSDIRLLRLMPHKDKAAPIQCQLFDYSLQESGKRTHLYEALSYAWGSSDKPRSISIDKYNLPVTVNLHAALSCLRDRFIERIIWVDAVCINQADLKERGLQVQLMVKIYSKANRVIVWLGEMERDSDQLFEDICLAANKKSMERLKKELNQQAILNLLQRPWFQRIWVLQEVAAARHIVIMCGPIEIDGYAFCLGLKSLELSYTASPKLQSLPSLTFLIEQAGLRPKYTTNSPERPSLEIGRLVELVDMFHSREASDVRDKVYALLGMSSDDPSKAGLQPDYNVPWNKLFRKLVKFVLYKYISVETSDNTQIAIIKSKGCILGQVSSARSNDRQNVNIIFISKNTAWCFGNKTEWTLQMSAKSIREGDIICLLQGASMPTIIRQCKDHFAVVVIAATPLNKGGSLGLSELSKSITHFPRDLLLLWDWEKPLGESQDQEDYEALAKNFHVLEYSKAELGDYSDKVTRTWNVALVLGDLEECKKAEEKLREAIEMVNGKEHPYRLKGQYSLTPLSWAAGNGHYAKVKTLLSKDGIDPDLKDNQYGQTPLSRAASNGHEAIVKLLLETGKANPDSKDKHSRTPLSRAAEHGHEAVVKLLLETGIADPDSKDDDRRTPLLQAAKNGHEAVVKLLLETGKADLNWRDGGGQTPISRAAKNGHEAIVKLLLETGMVDPDLKDKHSRPPLSWAAKHGHEAIVKLLLETGKANPDSKDKHSRTPLSRAAEHGHKAIVKLLLKIGRADPELKDSYSQTPLSWAAEHGHEVVVKLLLETGMADPDSKDNNDKTPLSWAAEHGHEAVVKLLLETGMADPDSKDDDGKTPLSRAAENGHEAIVKLLEKSKSARLLTTSCDQQT